VGCGGSGNQSNQPPPAPSFTIAVTPSAPSIAPGISSSFQVSITPQNGFSGAVAVTVTGLPTGLSANPSTFSVQNTQQTVTLTASSSLADGNYSFGLNGTSGSLSSSASVSVVVEPLLNFEIVQPASSQVVTTFGSTAQVQLQTEVHGSGFSNYQLDFAAAGLPTGVIASFSPNPVAVGSSTTLSVTAPASGPWLQNMLFDVVATPAVPVPAQNLSFDLVVAPPPGSLPNNRTDYLRTDDTPQSIVYDATNQQIFSSDHLLNRVDVVSTGSRQIVKSIPVMSPRGMALTLDGNKVLVGSDAQQAVAISTTTLEVEQVWKLPRLSGATYSPQLLYPLADGTVAIQIGGGLAIWNQSGNTVSSLTLPASLGGACYTSVSATGTMIIVADCGTPGHVALYNVATKTFSAPAEFSNVFNVAAGPDGSKFLISDGTYGLGIYDSQLQQTAILTGPYELYSFIFSSDGTRIYVNAGIIGVFDGSAGGLISTAPALSFVPPSVATLAFVGPLFAVDSTGIIYGAADHGIAFHDSTYSVVYVPGYGPPDMGLILTPSFGPVNVTTPTAFPVTFGFSATPDVWFAGTRATEATLGAGGALSVTAPALSQPGPVSVKIIEPDGVQIFNPLVFSYGPGLMFVNGDTASPNGKATSDIIGVGLPSIPGQIQVTVGGQSANIVSVGTAPIPALSASGYPYYPYPAVDVKITLPPGIGDEDIVVTTSAGAATLPKAIHYVESVTDYSSPDVFRAILLDRGRNQLYLSAGDHIDVFSLTTNQFLSPFTPPSLNGLKLFHGLALTPNGSQLLAANFADGSLALINPDQPNSATAVQIIPPSGNNGPEYIATTNTGKAFIQPSNNTSNVFYELDLSSLQVINMPSPVQGALLLAASGDGSELLSTTLGYPQGVAVYNSASNNWSTYVGLLNNLGNSAAVSLNGSVFAVGSGMVDSNANFLGYLAWQDVHEYGVGLSLPLEKVQDGGAIVYIPYSGSVDMFDVNHGALLHRLALTEQVQNVTDAMTIDAYGQNVYLITNAGLTVVQLNAAPLAIGSVAPAAGSTGTQVTIYGSGFQQTTAVTANGLPATTTFVNANTLLAVVPNLAAGSTQITVTDPSGETYSLDNAFTVQ